MTDTANVRDDDLAMRACELRSASFTYRQIAEQLGVAVSTAHDLVQRGLDQVPKEPNAALLALELAKLDRLERHLLGVMTREHLTVSHGRVVLRFADNGEGTPILDDGPGVQAALGLVRVAERRARLLGLDAPTKHSIEIIPQEVIDAEAARLEAEIASFREELDADALG